MDKAALIYDRSCPLCRGAAEWIRQNALPDTIELVPCQSDERKERFPQITEAACVAALQLVLPGGSIHAGEQAFPHLFRRLRRWRWLARAIELPGVSALSPLAYRWVARHRQALSGMLPGARGGPHKRKD